MFNPQRPTTQMLGRWQPWHDGHTELFKRALAETGQVCIMVRDVGGIVGRDAGDGRTNVQDDNPFSQREAEAQTQYVSASACCTAAQPDRLRSQ